MSLDSLTLQEEPLTHIGQLEAYFQSAEKPKATHRVGLEHEKLLFKEGQTTPVAYEGPSGVQALFGQLASKGWHEFRESPTSAVIALTQDEKTISLEPGGQFELSGSPFPTARMAHAENVRHVQELSVATRAEGLQMVAMGYRPFGTTADMPWMPKSRYRLMRQSLGPRGKYALDMMLMTATGQVSLDWADEADCSRKVTLAARMSPLLVALYANSPVVNGRPSGFMSFRSHVWTDVDNARCGYLPSMLDGRFSYRAYIEWALDAPLLFLRRDGQYLQPSMTFRQLLNEGYGGRPAQMSDWVDHGSTLFPEVRIKKLLEIRAADCVSVELTGALVALCRGLLYDDTALDDALKLLPAHSLETHLEWARVARTDGLRGVFQKRTLAEWATALLGIANEGLSRLDKADSPLLEPLFEQAASGRSPAETVLDTWQKETDQAAWLRRFQLTA